MSVKEQIFRLQVSINDIERMQIIQCEGNLCGIEFGNWVGEPLEHVSESE